MSEVVSSVGIHCVGDKRTGYGPFLQAIYAGGRRLSLVKVRDNFGAVDEPLLLWPDTLCIGVKTEWDGGPLNAQDAANKIIAARAQKPVIHYWEYLNEMNGIYSEQADFYIALMPLLAQAGIGLVMFSCASGTPPIPFETQSLGARVSSFFNEIGLALHTRSMTARLKRQLSEAASETPYEAIARACKFAKDNHYNVILGVHEYESSGGTIGRFETLADYLEYHSALLTIAITEYGYETHPGDSQFMTMIRANDPIYMADPRVVGCAAWTLGGGGWGDSNFQTALPALGEYIATVSPVTPPPPPADEFVGHFNDETGELISADPDYVFAMPAHDVSMVTRYQKKVIPPPVRSFEWRHRVDPPELAGRVTVNPPPAIYAVGTIIEVTAT